MKINELAITGFRSLQSAIWSPGDLNVVIGPNGSGKSNLLRFLELMTASAKGKLEVYVQNAGGMEALLWDGEARHISARVAVTPSPEGELGGQPLQYSLRLARRELTSTFRIDEEHLESNSPLNTRGKIKDEKLLERPSPHLFTYFDPDGQPVTIDPENMKERESFLSQSMGPFFKNRAIAGFQKQIAEWAIYHDIDMGKEAKVRSAAVTRIEKRVDPDGQNLIPVLHTLYEDDDPNFKQDVDMAMRVAFGAEFEGLQFPPAADQRIQMRIKWRSLKRAQSAADLSDGTLRFLFLLAVLASPAPPPLVAIDEPETGLHPAMFSIVAEYAMEAASRTQIVFTTHSPQFLDAFKDQTPTTTVTAWQNGETNLKNLDSESLQYWLKEYSLGALFRSGELETMS